MKIAIDMNTVINIGDIFYTVDICGDKILAHRCANMIISVDVIKCMTPTITYVSAQEYAFYEHEVYNTFDAALDYLKNV